VRVQQHRQRCRVGRLSGSVLKSLVHRLPLPVRRALGRLRELTAHAAYAATGRPPSWFKYADPHGYWNKRPMMLEELERGAHNTASQVAGREEFFEELGREAVHLVLDAGCGYGRELKAMHERLPSVRAIGVDFSFNQLRDAKQYFPAGAGRLVQASLDALPFREGAFDATYSTSAMTFLPHDVSPGAFDELDRVTRGRILHCEVVRQHLVGAGRTALIARFDLAEHMFDHDYAAEYRRRGRDVPRSQPLASYRRQPAGPAEEMWYSLVVVDRKRPAHAATRQ
jgi:SAM-dependent methyltransferase